MLNIWYKEIDCVKRETSILYTRINNINFKVEINWGVGFVVKEFYV